MKSRKRFRNRRKIRKSLCTLARGHCNAAYTTGGDVRTRPQRIQESKLDLPGNQINNHLPAALERDVHH